MKFIKLFSNELKKKKGKSIFLFLSIFLLGLIMSSGYFIYSVSFLTGDKTLVLIKYATIIAIVLVLFIFLLTTMRMTIKRKPLGIIILLLSFGIFTFGEFYIAKNMDKLKSSISNFTETTTTYSYSLISLNTSKIDKVEDVKSKKIGVMNDKESKNGYQTAKDLIKEYSLDTNNEIKEYDEPISLMKALYDKDVDFLVLPTSYVSMYKSMEGYEQIEFETKIIVTKSETKKEEAKAPTKKVTEPFTFLIMGIDSEGENISSGAANGDALILGTFNPDTLNTTMLSIPRDTYTYITCLGKDNKITHAGWGGVNCMKSTIEKLVGLDIDYYITINFKGVVHLVDELGGIEVDVPVAFCEQNSDRLFGKNEICLKPGLQKLNGEQALALSRHRHTLLLGDIQRGMHQQLVIKGILNKLKTISSPEKAQDILKMLSNNMKTNMTTEQILSFFSVGMDILSKVRNQEGDFISMQQLYLSGSDLRIYEESAGKTLYNYIYSKDSLKAVVDAMKVNLELIEKPTIKTFNFSINTPYEKKIIGKDMYGSIYISVLPSFIGKSRSYVEDWGRKNNININVQEIPSTTSSDINDNVISQSYPEGYRMDKISSLTIKVIKKTENNSKKEESNENSNLSSNNYLKTLTIKDNVISFDKTKTLYNITVDNSVTKLTVTATAEDDKANVSIVNNALVVGSSNQIVVTVTAEDKTTKKYIIVVTREAAEQEETPVDPIIPTPTPTPTP